MIIKFEAFRNSIYYQIQIFRHLFFSNPLNKSGTKYKCQATKLLVPKTDIHCDHVVHFFYLVNAFLASENLSDAKCVWLGGTNGFWGLEDRELDLRWQKYHLKNAKLRCVCSQFNLKRQKYFTEDYKEKDKELIKRILELNKSSNSARNS